MSKAIKKMLSIGVVCALMVCMAITTAFAEAATSTATVALGSKDPVNGNPKILYALSLNGSVTGTGNSTGSLTGEIWTKGALISVSRASATTKGFNTKTLYWANDGKETGTFWARCFSPNGNQGGQCVVTQAQ